VNGCIGSIPTLERGFSFSSRVGWFRKINKEKLKKTNKS